MKSLLTRAWPALFLLAALTVRGADSGPEYPEKGPDIYDVHADGSAQVAAAVAKAAAGHKRVLLIFGANWCIWCHRLHDTLQNNPAVSSALGSGYEVVYVDVNARHEVKRNTDVIARYGNPVRLGLPVLVVLDSDGKQLVTKDSGELEEGEGHSPAKITAFLAAWAPR